MPLSASIFAITVCFKEIVSIFPAKWLRENGKSWHHGDDGVIPRQNDTRPAVSSRDVAIHLSDAKRHQRLPCPRASIWHEQQPLPCTPPSCPTSTPKSWITFGNPRSRITSQSHDVTNLCIFVNIARDDWHLRLAAMVDLSRTIPCGTQRCSMD